MKTVVELLKALFFIVFNIFWEIIKNIWKPIYTSIVKRCIIALLAWSICHFVPHHLPFITHISYIGWVTIIILTNLLFVKYDDGWDEEETETPETPEDTTNPNYLQDEQTQKTLADPADA